MCLKAFFDSKWGIERQAIAASRLWRYCLIAVGSASSLVYPHAPFGFAVPYGGASPEGGSPSVGNWRWRPSFRAVSPLVSFATLAGITLSRRQAVVSAALIWFVNQFYGFTVRQYPLTAIAFLWGVTMGLGTVVVALIASMQPRFSHRSWVGQGVWLGISLLLGFAAYQSSILFVNQWVGMHGLTADVLLRIFVRDLIWAIALFGLHTIFVLNHQRILRRTLR